MSAVLHEKLPTRKYVNGVMSSRVVLGQTGLSETVKIYFGMNMYTHDYIIVNLGCKETLINSVHFIVEVTTT